MYWLSTTVFYLDCDITTSKAFGFCLCNLTVLKLSTHHLHITVHQHTEFHPSTRPRSRAILVPSSSLECADFPPWFESARFEPPTSNRDISAVIHLTVLIFGGQLRV